MYKNITSGAFSQRQRAKAARTPSVETSDINSENANICTVKVLYDNTMGDVISETLVNGSISVKKGDTVKLIAQPKSGYVFVRWEGVRDVEKTTSPTIDFVVNNDVVVTAVFAAEDAGGTPGGGDPEGPNKKPKCGLESTIKKYWWVLAIILGYLILKEDKE